MLLSRRNYLLLSAAALAGSASCKSASALDASLPTARKTDVNLPDRHNFRLGDTVYLDAGSQHPISNMARASLEAYTDHRQTLAPGEDYSLNSDAAIEKFARLVNADSSEITFVQSTTTGEQMIVRSLGLPEKGAKIVTDTLHFFGSFPLYEELEKQGCDVTWIRAKDGRIDMADIDKAITPDTRLVSLSLVSTLNGFEHDLKAVCDLAHSRGALVYADIIHAAGCVPVDLHASGVDFACCASYKWLMGDFGLGFLYVRRNAMQHLRRTNYGYYGISEFTPHIYPYDTPGDTVADYAFANNAAGWFALGTYSHTTVALLNASLDLILDLGVETIQNHAIGLTNRLKEGLISRGYDLITPPETTTPLVACAYEGARQKLKEPMKKAGIVTTLSTNRFRPSVSIFNTEDDVDMFLETVGTA